MAVSGAMSKATLAAVSGDTEMAWLYLHAARKSAEALARHLEQAAEELRVPVVMEEREGLESP